MRDAITSELALVGDRTAKQIAEAAGIELKDALRELGAMLGEGVVERAKRKGKNEYVYWLTTTAKPAGNPAGNSQIAPDDTDSEGGEADMTKVCAALERELDKAQAEVIRLRNQVAEVEGVGVDQCIKIASLTTERDQAIRSEAEKHERMMAAHSEAERLRAELAASINAGNQWQAEISRMRIEAETSRRQIADLQKSNSVLFEQRETLREALDAIPTVEDNTAGYLIRAPKRKPAIVTNGDAAVKRAMAAARNGSGRADVYALVLTGTARRGAEWRPA